MSAVLGQFAQQILCGAVAAAGFGVLFNFSLRRLSWCAASGAVALGIRTCALNAHWSLEAASFVAALALGCLVQLTRIRSGISRNTLAVTGCIPMVPGSFATKAILGLFALTSPTPQDASATLLMTSEYTLRLVFTIGAIGTGLAIPTFLARMKIGPLTPSVPPGGSRP